MKKFLYLIPFMGIFLSVSQKLAQSCPTCVGKVYEESSPFFTDECYECGLNASNLSTDFTQTDTNSLSKKE